MSATLAAGPWEDYTSTDLCRGYRDEFLARLAAATSAMPQVPWLPSKMESWSSLFPHVLSWSTCVFSLTWHILFQLSSFQTLFDFWNLQSMINKHSYNHNHSLIKECCLHVFSLTNNGSSLKPLLFLFRWRIAVSHSPLFSVLRMDLIFFLFPTFR